MDDFLTDTQPDPTRRDRWGRYLVLPPDSSKPVGYTRATTIAKTIDDTSALTAWKSRMVAIGLAKRPDLYAVIDDTADDKTELNRLCEKAAEAGGATVRRDLGTHLHSILERSFTDPDYTPPAAYAGDVEAVHDTLTAHGYRVLPDMCERIVVNDSLKIAGTFDLMLIDAHNNLILADIKTGSSVKYSGVSFATQLSIYANADSLYTQGAAADGSEDEREPMPDVVKDHAVIIHVEPGSSQCELHRLTLDIALVDLAMTVRETRNRKDLLTAIDTPTPGNDDDMTAARDRWIRERITVIRDADAMRLANAWPASVLPPKRQPVPYTTDQIATLLPVIDALEADMEMPFPDRDPATPRKKRTPRAPQTPPEGSTSPEMPDEGVLVPDLLPDLQAAFQQELNDNHRERIREWVRHARIAQLPVRPAEHPSTRRIAIAYAMIAACVNNLTDTQLRDLMSHTLDDDAAQHVDIGAAFGLHTADRAQALRSLTEMGATITHTGDGNPQKQGTKETNG